jgi:hypothetical protein
VHSTSRFYLSGIATATAVLMLQWAAASAAAAAPVADDLPTPGLYRVDSDGTSIYRDGTTVQQKNDGATGGGSLRAQAPGGVVFNRGFTGDGPKQICIGARAANGGLPLPAMLASQGCKGSPPVTGPNGTTYSSRCDAADITTVVRKVDAKTWEMKVAINEHFGAKGMVDFDQQRKMFETSAKNATTPEDRADAEYTLSHWEEFKADLRESAAETGAAGAPGASKRTSTMVSRWTRIGDSCKSGR